MKPGLPSSNPRILVAPLDWGLGHAARCIPLIYSLLAGGARVVLAGEGTTGTLLKTEFPELPFLPLQGYRIQYGASRIGTAKRLMRQLPGLLRAIQAENKWLRQMVAQHSINAVISDNRYGLHHPDIPSIIITHQLLVKTGLRATDRLLQKALYRFIDKFNDCWVPDDEGAANLAGALSHPARRPEVPVTYIGPLSRFQSAEPVLTHYLLALLSGPEPQRSILEEKLLQQAQLFQNPMLMVRGLPGATGLPKVPYHVTIVNHLPTATLQRAIEGAQFVVSRCGYSTVMDMTALQKKCIYIPTPGQTEQEYLATHLMKTNAALAIPQQKFNLKAAVALAESFPYQLPVFEKNSALQDAVDDLLKRV